MRGAIRPLLTSRWIDRRIVALTDEGIRDREVVRLMRVEERERNERLTERSVLEARCLNGELESLCDDLPIPTLFPFSFSYPLS